MQTINETSYIKYEIKKSTFISYITPMNLLLDLHKNLKKEHPKAAHVVYAYRYLNEFLQIVENSSDDGEPKGTSGPPILNVLRGAKLVNCGILVVRYFGGIKLGTGGLVRAYGTSAKMVINGANLSLHEEKHEFSFSCLYTLVQRIEHYLNKEQIAFSNREFQATIVSWSIELTKEQKTFFVDFLLPFKEEKRVFF